MSPAAETAPSPTPILDRQQPAPGPKKATRQRAIGVAIGVVIGLAIAFAPPAIDNEFSFSLAAFVVALIGGVIVHELGHWVAGAAAGLEFRHIRAGALMLTKESGGYRFRFLPRHLMGGGQTFMVPRAADDLRRRYFVFGAGGPIATALMFLPVAILPWGATAASLLLADLLLAFFSWTPLVVGGHYTDGKLLLLLARRGPAADRFATVLYLTAIDNNGIPPRQWPPDALHKLAVEADAHFRAGGRYRLYLRARDGGTPPEMAAGLDYALAASAEMHPMLRRTSFAAAAFFQGVFGRNAALARAWLEDARKVKGVVAEKDWDAYCLGAIALAEGNAQQAREQFVRAMAALDRQPGASGSRAAARARIVALMDEARD